MPDAVHPVVVGDGARLFARATVFLLATRLADCRQQPR